MFEYPTYDELPCFLGFLLTSMSQAHAEYAVADSFALTAVPDNVPVEDACAATADKRWRGGRVGVTHGWVLLRIRVAPAGWFGDPKTQRDLKGHLSPHP